MIIFSEIHYNISRNETQIEALQKVQEKIEYLVEMVQSNSPEAEPLANSYLNSCSNGTGSRFEALLLSCTSEDQKAVKEQIKNIVDNMKALEEKQPLTLECDTSEQENDVNHSSEISDKGGESCVGKTRRR